MTTELQTLDNLSYEEIAKLTGMAQPTSTMLPSLKVNREDEDENGNKLPMGFFVLTQGDSKYFSKEATFRPFINAYQYAEWNNPEKKYTNRSIIIKSFNEEAIDMKGGIACGKISSKKMIGASEALKNTQKDLKIRRLLYGLTTLSHATDIAGNNVTDITSVPSVLMVQGSNFMAPNEAIKSIEKVKHHLFQHEFILGKPDRKKNGATVFYLIPISVDLDKTLKFGDDEMEAFKIFQEVINTENAIVAKAWREVKRNTDKSIDDMNVLSQLDLNDDISDL